MNAVHFALLGLGTGGLYAIIGIGLVLVYRASGVLNFASGAVAAICAFIFYDLHTTHGVNLYLSVVVTILAGAAIGMAIHVGVMARLRQTSALVKLIATLGVLALLDGIAVIKWGANIVLVNSILPTKALSITHNLTISEDRAIIIVGTIVLAVGLKFLYSRTTFGLATSAVAENRRAAASSGWSTSRIELINWAVGGALSALAGIFLAPIVGLQVQPLSLLVLPALAAALLGRFESFLLTFAGAMLIGVIQSECALYVHVTGISDSIPFLIIIGVLLAGGSARPTRGDLSMRLPAVGNGRVNPTTVVAGFAIGLVLIWTLNSEWLSGLLTTFIFAIVLLSVVVVTGYAGQLSLGQWALAGLGAWFAARLVVSLHFPFWAAVICGIIGAAISGVIVALPSLRTRGVNLAMVTLGLAEVITAVVLSNGSLTGGFGGLNIGSPHLFGINLDVQAHPQRYTTLALVAFFVAGLVVSNVRRGRTGRRMLAVRCDETAAAALGVGVYGAKLFSFGLAAAIAGLAGILAAFRNPVAVFSQFDIFTNIYLLMYAVIGGVGWVSGTSIGATLAAGSITAIIFNVVFGSDINNYLAPVAGFFVIFNLVIAPDGLAAIHEKIYSPKLRQLNNMFARVVRKVVPQTLRRREPTQHTPHVGEQRPSVALEVRGISVRYGGVKALQDVSLRVQPGEVLGLIGPNGAGKTTLLDAVTGFTRPASGTVRLGETDIVGWSPVRISRAGVGRSFQGVQLFDAMTIRDNLLTAMDDKSVATYFKDLVRPRHDWDSEQFAQVAAQFQLESVLDRRPGEISHAAARLVGVARAVLARPAVLFLDEPAAGLGAEERAALRPMIRSLARQWGMAVVLVEHDVSLVMDVCDNIVVLNFGQQIASGTPSEIRNDEAVIAAYLGEDAGQASVQETADVELGAATA